MVSRKTLVLDLDETLIHSHHDGVMRQTVTPGTPPDFVLKVSGKQGILTVIKAAMNKLSWKAKSQ